MIKSKIKKTIINIFIFIFILSLTGCFNKNYTVDYNEKTFESALNSGKNLEGKVVAFTVRKIAPKSAFGYNLQSGEHLNFVSQRHPKASVGDTVVVRVGSVESVLGSWIIRYYLLDINPSKNTATASSELNNTSLNKEVSTTKEITTSAISETTTHTTTKETTTETTTMNIQDKVVVKVTNKKNLASDPLAGRYFDFAQFTIQATNNTPSSIRGIQGVLYIDDMFGENILRTKCDLTGQTIYSGQTVTYSNYGIENNFSLDDSREKIYSTDFNDLKFTYVVNQIVYGDGTSEIAEEDSNENSGSY